MDIYFKLKNNKLESMNSIPFSKEKEIQNLVENNLEEIFSLTFLSTEFRIKNQIFDTLCFDEDSRSFVIIEYKNSVSKSVSDQGMAYLSTLINNKADFILELIDKNISIKKEEIDWSQSKVIFIAPKFMDYSKSINLKVPWELWEINKLPDNVISFRKYETDSNQSLTNLSDSSCDSQINTLGKEIKVYTEEDLLKNRDTTKELYFSIKDELLKLHDSNFVARRTYMSFRKNNKVVLYIGIGKKDIEFQIVRRTVIGKGNKDLDSARIMYEIKDPKNLFRTKIIDNGKKESYFYNMTDKKDFNFLIDVIKDVYESK